MQNAENFAQGDFKRTFIFLYSRMLITLSKVFILPFVIGRYLDSNRR